MMYTKHFLKHMILAECCHFLISMNYSFLWKINSYRDDAVADGVRPNLMNSRTSEPLSNISSLACHNRCDTGHISIRKYTPVVERLNVNLLSGLEP